MRSLQSPLLLESLGLLVDADELAEVLDVCEHGVLLHGEVVFADEQPHQLLVELLDLGEVVVLDELQLGHVEPGQGSSVELEQVRDEKFQGLDQIRLD